MRWYQTRKRLKLHRLHQLVRLRYHPSLSIVLHLRKHPGLYPPRLHLRKRPGAVPVKATPSKASGAVPVKAFTPKASGAVPEDVEEAAGAGPVLIPKAAGVAGYHRLNLPPAPIRPLSRPTTSLRP